MLKKRKLLFLSIVFSAAPVISGAAFAECANDIIGKWQQSYVEFAGNKIKDESQSWEFMANGRVRFMKPGSAIDVSGDYSCEADIIYMQGSSPGRLKILTSADGSMSWESLDHGGGITHVVKVE